MALPDTPSAGRQFWHGPFFSKFEFDSHARLKLEAFEIPALEMILRLRDGKTLAVVTVHPVPPVGGNYTQSRDNYLAKLSRHLHGQKKPCIVIGDFNATPWHPPVRRLLNQNQLMYALPGLSMFSIHLAIYLAGYRNPYRSLPCGSLNSTAGSSSGATCWIGSQAIGIAVYS